MRDKSLRLLDRTFLWWHLALGTVFFCVGWQMWDLRTGISFVLWGMFLRLVYMLHVTWAVNSASHMWGYRTYPTRDNSRNLWWVGMLAFGEGWHNNHHHFPGAARQGFYWWEVDLTWYGLKALAALGVIRDLKGVPQRVRDARRVEALGKPSVPKSIATAGDAA